MTDYLPFHFSYLVEERDSTNGTKMNVHTLVLAFISAAAASAAIDKSPVRENLPSFRGTDGNERELLVPIFGVDYLNPVGYGRCKDADGRSYDAIKIKYDTNEVPLFEDCASKCLSKQCNDLVGIEDHKIPNGNGFCHCLYPDESILGSTHIEQGVFTERLGEGPVISAEGENDDSFCYRKKADACDK